MRSRSFIYSRKQGGFTLVEMLVSVALVIVLMLAVTQIFTITSKTMGGSQAVSAGIRDSQAVQAVMGQDLANAASDGACFVITNQSLAMTRSAQDTQTGLNFAQPSTILTEDVDGDGKIDTNDYFYPSNSPTQSYSPLQINNRSHRKDFLMFCARGNYPRQTANPGRLVSEMSSREAVIFYHHLSLPNGSAARYFYPGQVDVPPDVNDTNRFASQWILGRVAMLMVSPQAGRIYDRSGPATPGSVADQNYYPRVITSGSTELSPFHNQSKAQKNYTAILDSPTTYLNLQDARYDLVGASLAEFKSDLAGYIAATPAIPWYTNYMGNDGNRFHAVPYLSQITDPAKVDQQLSQKLARTTPIFLPSCSQFVVEFAGDFIIQDWDPNGNGTPDETADRAFTKTHPNTARGNTYYGRVVGAGTDSRTDTCPLTSQIRWYGLPRDTNDDRRIVADDGDVATLRDVIGARQTIEKALPTTTPNSAVATDRDYNNSSQVTLTASPAYTVAWGPVEMADSSIGKPKMIRITVAIDRPESEGKLNEAQTFQYVFKVGL